MALSNQGGQGHSNARSYFRSNRQYVRRCIPFGFAGIGSNMFVEPPSFSRIPCARHIARLYADLRLSLVCEVVTLPARKDTPTIQHCYATSAARRRTEKPRPSPAVVAPSPVDTHAVFFMLPRVCPRPMVIRQNNATGLADHGDGAARFTILRPLHCVASTWDEIARPLQPTAGTFQVEVSTSTPNESAVNYRFEPDVTGFAPTNLQHLTWGLVVFAPSGIPAYNEDRWLVMKISSYIPPGNTTPDVNEWDFLRCDVTNII
jgi:hypothetical protein